MDFKLFCIFTLPKSSEFGEIFAIVEKPNERGTFGIKRKVIGCQRWSSLAKKKEYICVDIFGRSAARAEKSSLYVLYVEVFRDQWMLPHCC